MTDRQDLTGLEYGDFTVLYRNDAGRWAMRCNACGQTKETSTTGIRAKLAASICVCKGILALSPRQAEIAQMAADGLQNKQIAKQLEISHQTVKNILTQVYEKTRAVDRTALAVLLSRKQATMKKRAIYLDDEPQNLEAAATDALTWLNFWQDYAGRVGLDEKWNENRNRLTQAILALQTQLDGVKMEFRETKKPELTGLEVVGNYVFIPNEAGEA